MKIVVTGSKGQLGSELLKMSKNCPTYEYVFVDIEQLDLTNYGALEHFLTIEQSDVVINCAAYTAVDNAEKDLETASAVNIGVVEKLSKMSLKFGFFLIQISTDYVFDGRQYAPISETHPMSPESVYGLTKAGGEAQMRTICPHGAIIRTAWLYSIFGNNFVKSMRKLGAMKSEIKVVSDQIGTPTSTTTLANFILTCLPEMIAVEGVETYHLTDSGVTSWYDFAFEIMKMSRLNCKVLPIPSSEYPAIAPRPHYSVLNKQKIFKKFGFIPPHWTESLQQCINELNNIEEKN